MMRQLLVQTEPKLKDPRELETILTCSIRSLFGDFEHHSYGLRVSNSEGHGTFLVACQPGSVDAVRSALTMVTLPAYLESSTFRFDVVEVRANTDVSG